MTEWTDGSCEKEEWFGINSKKMELDVLSDKTFFQVYCGKAGVAGCYKYYHVKSL